MTMLKRKPPRCARSKVSSRSTRPSRPTSFRAHNHETKRATGVRAISSNAGCRARVLSFVAAGEAPLRAPGRLLWYSDATLGGPLTALARDAGPTSSEAGIRLVAVRWDLAAAQSHAAKAPLVLLLPFRFLPVFAQGSAIWRPR
jgi:hypothetical protein